MRTITLASTITRAAEDEPFAITISSDRDVPTPFWGALRLSHAASAIEMSDFATRGLPVNIGHRADQLPVGRARRPRIEQRTGYQVLVGDLTLSASHPELSADIVSGIVQEASVSAEILEVDESTDVPIATRWRPTHVALVSDGADPAAGINRGANPVPNPSPDPTVDSVLDGLPERYQVLRVRARAENVTDPDVVRGWLGELYAADHPSPPATPAPPTVVSDPLDKVLEHIQTSVEQRVSLPIGDRENPYRGWHLAELAKEYVRHVDRHAFRAGADKILDRALIGGQVVQRAAGILSHGASDFSALLAQVSEKSLRSAYEEAPETFRAWTGVVPMSNFKTHNFPILSTATDPEDVPDGTGELKYGTIGEKQEQLTLSTKGQLISITRKALVDDDLNALGAVPRSQSQAMVRVEANGVYNVLNNPPSMLETGTDLFHADHNNLAALGAAPSVATLDAAFSAMALQRSPGNSRDPNGSLLNLEPSWLIVPKALENTVRALVANEKDPSEGATTSFSAMNPFFNRLQVVSDARLDAASTTAWYLAAGFGAGVDTIARGYLNGATAPTMSMEEGFSTLGVTYRIYHDFTSGPLDYRGLYKNAGA